MRKSIALIPLTLLSSAPAFAGGVYLGEGMIEAETFVNENPLGPGENIKAMELYRAEGFSVHFIQIRGSEKPHTHGTHDLIVVMKKGKGRLNIGVNAIELKEGDTALIPKGVAHWFENTGEGPSAGLGIFVPAFDGKDVIPAAGKE